MKSFYYLHFFMVGILILFSLNFKKFTAIWISLFCSSHAAYYKNFSHTLSIQNQTQLIFLFACQKFSLNFSYTLQFFFNYELKFVINFLIFFLHCRLLQPRLLNFWKTIKLMLPLFCMASQLAAINLERSCCKCHGTWNVISQY